MNRQPDAAVFWAGKLRSLLARDDYTLWDGLPEIISRIVKQSPLFLADDAQKKGVAEVRILLFRLASRTVQCSLAVACVRGLLHLGGPGRVMALHILARTTWSEHEVIPLLERFSSLEILCLVHQALQEPCPYKGFLRTWAEDKLVPSSGCDPEIIYDFCVRLGREGGRLPFLLRQHLQGGGFAPWFETFLRGFGEAGVQEDALFAVHALGEPLFALMLADHVHALSATGRIRFCRIAAELCRDQASALAKRLVPRLTMLDAQGVCAVIRCLLLVQWAKTREVLLLLRRKRPELLSRLQLLAFWLPGPGAMDTACQQVRSNPPDVNLALVAGLCRIDPDGMDRICSATVWSEANQDGCRVVGEYARQCSRRGQVPSHPGNRRPAATKGKHTPWQRLTHLFTPKNARLEEVLHPHDEVTDRRFKKDHLHDRGVSLCTFRHVVFEGCSFIHTVFNKVRFLGCTFTATRFEACAFNECVFSRCAFDQGALHESTMQGCLMEDVDISRFLGVACSFTRHRLQGCMLDQVVWDKCTLQRCTLDMCLVRQVCWDRCTLSSARLMGTMVEDTWIRQTAWHGVEMDSCWFEETRFLGLTMRNCRADDTPLTSCWFEGLDSLEPVFYAASLETLFWNASFETGKQDVLPEDLDPQWVQDVLAAWRYEQVVKTTEQCMLHNNKRRLGLASERFALDQNDFFRVLPCLLCSSRFEEYMDLQGIPRCSIDGFTPDYSQLCLLDRLFPFIKERCRSVEPVSEIRIAAVYTLGSLGTVAQNKRSDVDVWVCLADGQTDGVMRSRLTMKCEAISRWAQKEYALELHFFVMTLDAIRSNHFGMLSREGSGSAQALLLKEEFYRTALLLGGRSPRWWSLPCQTCRFPGKEVPCPQRKARSCDLGEIKAIPREEFFGASLWQIVGSARNPYKSLLKLGLLEKYAVQGAMGHNMLSETIKSNLLGGKQEISQIDPYGLLYHELVRFYSKLGDREGCILLQESFRSKVRMEEMDLSCGYPRRREEQSLLSQYAPSSRISEDKSRPMGRRWSMSGALEMGEAMSTFMLRAYKRIQVKVAAGGGDVAIRPEEMTMLGRTIMSYFGREPGKVRRMFFIRDTDYREIYVYGEKTSQGSPMYVAKARRPYTPRISEHLHVVRRDRNPFRLMAWLTVNHVYKRGVEVSGNPSLAPLSVAFFQGAMQGVLETFPPKEVLRINQDDLLEEKRVKKVLCFLQKGQDQDDCAPEGVDILYSTSWGELYCVHVDQAATVRTDPMEFFARNLPCPLDWEAKLYQYRASTGRVMPLAST